MEKLHRALWLAFKVGLPLGVGILLLGTIAAGLYDPQRFGNQVPPRVAAVAETVMATACLALALAWFLESYVYVRRTARSVRFAISAVIWGGFGVVLMASGAVVLAVLAVQDWLEK